MTTLHRELGNITLKIFLLLALAFRRTLTRLNKNAAGRIVRDLVAAVPDHAPGTL